MTKHQAAEYLGVPARTYIKWESGERTPPSVAVKLLDVMGSLETIAPAIHDYFLPKYEDCNVTFSSTPPQRKPLTDEQIMDLCAAEWASHPIEVTRIIEAAHGIKKKPHNLTIERPLNEN